MIRYVFVLLLFIFIFTLGLKADDLSIIRQKYIESILYKNKSEQQLIRLMCQTSHEKIVGDQIVVELMERCHGERDSGFPERGWPLSSEV